MTDECPTHGADCPGHLHAEVIGGKAYWALPGLDCPSKDCPDHRHFDLDDLPVIYPADLDTWMDQLSNTVHADLDRVLQATARKLTVSMTFDARDVDPKTYALLTGSTIPPPWKKPPPPPYPIDLEKVRWTAAIGRGAPPRMEPLQRFGSFLLSETEIAWLKHQGVRPW